MANLVDPTLASLTAEVEALRTRAERITAGLSQAQLNWQPEHGRKWSVGQCFDHLTRANTVYLDAVTAAIDAAPPRAADPPVQARANRLARWFISALEPSSGPKLKAPAKIQPGSDIDLDVARRFDETLQRLLATLPRAWTVDVNRTRFRNPLARGLRLFNITAAFQILTTHCRRHLWQAEQVQARSEWPRA